MCFEILDKDNKTKQITIQTNTFLGEIERERERIYNLNTPEQLNNKGG